MISSDCPKLENAVPHLHPSTVEVKPGTQLRLSCDPGFYLLGEPVLHCQNRGEWSHPLPSCERKPRKEKIITGSLDCHSLFCVLIPVLETGKHSSLMGHFSSRAEVIEPERMCVFQGCPAGLPSLWRTAGSRAQTSTPEALWNINVTLDFTCWETPKCTAPTVANGEEIHQPVLVIPRTHDSVVLIIYTFGKAIDCV